jgi:predicted ribosome quality control (RQC) complex YloA/Tae2 family protein
MKTVETLNGSKILIGQNARENDQLTFEVARPDDYWLHAKDCPGAHVVLQGPCTPECLEEAVRQALHHSKAKMSVVEICRVGHVTKPHKAPPGLVELRNSWTYVLK